MNTTKEIEHAFFNLLQSDIEMSIGTKRYRYGKFTNFKMMDIYIQIELLVKGKHRKVEIPLPFKITATSDTIMFSYKMLDMGDYGEALDRKIKKSLGIGKSKLYNNVLSIRRTDGTETKIF